MIAPTKHATVPNIRSYLRKKMKITPKQKKEITEENCVEKWEKHYGKLPESDSESERESF